MSKVVLLGDTHFHYSKANPVFHRYFEKFYKFMFSYMDKHEIKYLIQEGDLFDNKREIHFSSIKEINEYFFTPIKERNIQTYVISGNHDVLYKNTSEVNSISLLCPDYITIVDKLPLTCNIGLATFDLFPWINDSNVKESLQLAKSTKSEYGVGHFEFAGFPMYPGRLAESGMSHKDFSNYKEVFSGHYHTISTKDNILYTGTPYELNWTDCADRKGFWVLDTLDGAKEFIQNPYSLYEKISYVEDMEYDINKVTDKFVKINVISKVSQKKFDIFVDNLKLKLPLSVNITDISVQDSVESVVSTVAISTTQDMIGVVIDTIDTSLDKGVLKNYILDIYSEAIRLSSE